MNGAMRKRGLFKRKYMRIIQAFVLEIIHIREIDVYVRCPC